MGLPRAFARLNRHIGFVANLAGVFGLVSAAFGWLAKKMTYFGVLGWPEAIFIGVGAACVVVLVLSAGAAGWRFLRPVPQAQPAVEQVAQPGALMNIAEHPVVIALTKSIYAAEGELQMHETTMRGMEDGTAQMIANERSWREGGFAAVEKRMDEERAAQETWNEQTRQMMLGDNDMANKFNIDLRRALAKMPNLIGWISTTVEMQDLNEEITRRRRDTADGRRPPSPTSLIDRFELLSTRLQEYHLAVTGVTHDDPKPEQLVGCAPHELAFFDWGDDWPRYCKALSRLMQERYAPYHFDIIYR